MVNFDISHADEKLIAQIVNRFVAEAAEADAPLPNDSVLCLTMDITACHANDCQMDLARWLKAPRLDFLHDVLGIHRHIDRTTGKLGDHFLPRFAKPLLLADVRQ